MAPPLRSSLGHGSGRNGTGAHPSSSLATWSARGGTRSAAPSRFSAACPLSAAGRLHRRQKPPSSPRLPTSTLPVVSPPSLGTASCPLPLLLYASPSSERVIGGCCPPWTSKVSASSCPGDLPPSSCFRTHVTAPLHTAAAPHQRLPTSSSLRMLASVRGRPPIPASDLSPACTSILASVPSGYKPAVVTSKGAIAQNLHKPQASPVVVPSESQREILGSNPTPRQKPPFFEFLPRACRPHRR